MFLFFLFAFWILDSWLFILGVALDKFMHAIMDLLPQRRKYKTSGQKTKKVFIYGGNFLFSFKNNICGKASKSWVYSHTLLRTFMNCKPLWWENSSLIQWENGWKKKTNNICSEKKLSFHEYKHLWETNSNETTKNGLEEKRIRFHLKFWMETTSTFMSSFMHTHTHTHTSLIWTWGKYKQRENPHGSYIT